mgnify:FL=1|tara:strand:+ start:1955 stop:2128 length:174 start_codon:yes stop_codon:yes gene_type:complete
MAKKKFSIQEPTHINEFDSVQKVAYIPRNKVLKDRLKEKLKIQEQLKKEANKTSKKK